MVCRDHAAEERRVKSVLVLAGEANSPYKRLDALETPSTLKNELRRTSYLVHEKKMRDAYDGGHVLCVFTFSSYARNL